MATYILISRLTDEGCATLTKNPDRIKEVNQDVESRGGKVVAARSRCSWRRGGRYVSRPCPPWISTSSSPPSSSRGHRERSAAIFYRDALEDCRVALLWSIFS
jgi:hypothetical protein